MKPYIAVGLNADNGNKVYADGDTPRDARMALQKRYLHLVRVLTMYVPFEERRHYQKLMEAQWTSS